jgi:hypothetical protein
MKILMWEHFAPGGSIRVGGHHLAERFLRDGDEIAWCAGPLSPANFFKSNDETRARMNLWRAGGRRDHEGRLFAYAPMTLLPWRRYPLLDRVEVAYRTLDFSVPSFRKVLRRAGFGGVDLLFMEPGAPMLALLERVPHRRSVYRMCDDTAAFPDTPRSFAAVERTVCLQVDLVVATARRLARRAEALGARRVLYLPNACEPDRFGASAAAQPAALSGLPRPRAVYAGAIDSWFDAPLLAAVARRLPRWTFVLIGPERADLSECAGLGNVVRLGPQPYEALPAFLQHSDAGIVPFRISPMTHAIHPIKVYEYCAAGLPVVTTPLEETLAMGAPLAAAGDAEAFARELEAAASTRLGREGHAFARAHTWEARYQTLRSALAALEPRSERLAAAGGSR